MTLSSPAWPQVGVFSYGYHDVDSLVSECKQYGLTAVQLGGPLLNHVLVQPEHIPALRGELEANGISIVGLAAYRNIVALDPTKRRVYLDYLTSCLEIAPLLGTPVVATETGTRHPENEWVAVPENQSPEAWSILHESLAELTSVAEACGSILALEGYVNNIVGTYDQMASVLEFFSSPHLRVVLDPYNYLSRHLLSECVQATEAFFRRFKDHFVIAHLKDVCLEGAEVDTPEFGLGVFPQAIYIEFLRTQRPDLPLILEHLPDEHIPAALERLQTLIASRF